MADFSFRLFVVGQTERSQAAWTNLRTVCERLVPGRYEIEVVDAAEHPELAAEQRVLATPTVVRIAPGPQRRVVGDLSDHSRTTAALGLPGNAELPPEWRCDS
ncbi:circadian clock protein KaiB [Saccharopolyspora rhizosphaerae]|uniref:Circadian clock protein KaiB n=1 Tax=Saccharopolyspora rhizosphaerae TaxID=2492662 RepID=A0A3R8PBN3_9PSEU|nr:circadian clock protein KaiB [Saccharopolyspora rhizosphaerae]